MLLIGDIHINTRYKDKILDALKQFVAKYPDQQDIIFLGDYVYHFAYDRASLLALYDLLLDWYSQGKHIYLLAGNHDWLGNTFVFQEAQKAFEILEKLNLGEGTGKLKFITSPTTETIQGKKCFFLPYTIDFLSQQVEDKGVFSALLHSNNKHEQFSGKINQYLREYLQQPEHKNSLVFHHYYIVKTSFPGQKSRFGYKDVALSDQFLENPDFKMISGHLHQPFVHKNYLCTGSVWSTSPLEANQLKGLRHYDPSIEKFAMHVQNINPYRYIEATGSKDLFASKVSKEGLGKHYESIVQDTQKNMTSDTWRVELKDINQLKYKGIYLQLKVDKVDYDHIDEYIDPEVRSELRDLKLKKHSASVDELIKDLDLSGKNLSAGFGDWKEILKTYLQKKYSDEYQKYESLLQEMKLL